MLKRLNALIVIMFKNHNRIVKTVEFSLPRTSVLSATCTTMMKKKRKFIIATSVEYAESVAEINLFIVTHATPA